MSHISLENKDVDTMREEDLKDREEYDRIEENSNRLDQMIPMT